MSKTIPCQAKDPNTCPYHGAARRMDTALAAGDMNAYITAQEDMEKATKTTPEAVAYFAKKPVVDEAALAHYNRGQAQGLKAIKHWADAGRIAVGQDSTTPPGHHYATAKVFGKTVTYLLDSDENGNPRGIVGRIETYRKKSTTYNGNSLQGGGYLGTPTDSASAFQQILAANEFRVSQPTR